MNAVLNAKLKELADKVRSFAEKEVSDNLIQAAQEMDKAGIVRLGRKIAAPFDLIWSCYEGGPRMCGRCESCLRFRRALTETGNREWFLHETKRAIHRGFGAQAPDRPRPAL